MTDSIISHGRNRWRDRGKPRKYRTERTCSGKRRFSDEIAARAAGAIDIEAGEAQRLWVYPCQHCAGGWHLTSKNQGPRWLIVAENPVGKANADRP